MVGESIAVANGRLLSSQTRVAGDDLSAPLRETQDPEFSIGVISSTVWVGCYPSWQRAVLSAPGCTGITTFRSWLWARLWPLTQRLAKAGSWKTHPE